MTYKLGDIPANYLLVLGYFVPWSKMAMQGGRGSCVPLTKPKWLPGTYLDHGSQHRGRTRNGHSTRLP